MQTNHIYLLKMGLKLDYVLNLTKIYYEQHDSPFRIQVASPLNCVSYGNLERQMCIMNGKSRKDDNWLINL